MRKVTNVKSTATAFKLTFHLSGSLNPPFWAAAAFGTPPVESVGMGAHTTPGICKRNSNDANPMKVEDQQIAGIKIHVKSGEISIVGMGVGVGQVDGILQLTRESSAQ